MELNIAEREEEDEEEPGLMDFETLKKAWNELIDKYYKVLEKNELLSATLDKVRHDALEAKMSLNLMEYDHNKLVIENNLFHKLYVRK